MKKILLMMSTVALLFSCSSDEIGGIEENGGNQEAASLRSTEVYVQNKKLASRQLLSDQSTNPDYGHAYFFIRIDNRIPGYESQSSKLYYPATSKGGSLLDEGGLNAGLIDATYDYNSVSGSISKYIFDPTGTVTAKTIKSQPTIAQLIEADKYGGHPSIKNINTDTLKVIWYVTKLEGGYWHVDGVLTGKSTKTATEAIPEIDNEYKDCEKEDAQPEPDQKGDETITPIYSDSANIEVDVHQQEHSNWDEVKTSIHIREYVDKVTVEIPIGRQNLAEADDFAVRHYDYFVSLPDMPQDMPLSVKVSHEDDRLVIEVTLTEAAKKYIADLKSQSNDGVTIEVHSYPKDLTRDEVWAKLQGTKAYTSPQVAVKFPGATSAFFKK